jgi:hypothetical protein
VNCSWVKATNPLEQGLKYFLPVVDIACCNR